MKIIFKKELRTFLQIITALLLIFFIYIFAISVKQFILKSPPANPSPADKPKISADNNRNLFYVSRVIDGDTFILSNGERVRLVGVDAPEMNYHKGKPECKALEAKLFLKELVENKKVRLVKDKSNRDKYRRLLRYVYTGDKFAGEELVKKGLSRVKYYYPDVSKFKYLKSLEKIAKENKIGLWSEDCN